jgi:hypothetical protein
MKADAIKFPLVPFGGLRPSPLPAYLVKGLIPRIGLSVAWGPPKCGKSFWMYDVAMHVACGWSYRDRRVHGGAVVYCAFEGASGFNARAEAFRVRHKLTADADVPFYLSPTQMDLVADGASLTESIRAQCQLTPVLVVLDTLNRSLRGSESDDKDMSAYVRAADAIRNAFGCAVVIVHHCGIDATRPRGHTALAGAVDAQIAVKRDEEDKIIAVVEHMKDGPEGDTIVSALEVVDVGTDEDGERITSCVIVPADPSNIGRRGKLSGAAKIALDLLERAIADNGEPAPASNHIPCGARTISHVRWRSYCDAGTVSKTDTPDSRRKAFVRAVEALQTRGIIGVWQEHVWLAGQVGQ